MSKWYSRGADSNIESFYTTEYASRYQRPATTACTTRSLGLTGSSTFSTTNPKGSGFSDNAHVSPLELNKISDKDTWVSTSHAAHSQFSTVYTLMQPHETKRSTMEKSGYWNEGEPGILYQTPYQRSESVKTRSLTANSISDHTLKQIAKKNAIDAENFGNGPEWGSTTSGTAYHKHESSHDRFWKTKRELIGKKEQNGFTRQHLTINETPIVDSISTTHATYTPPDVRKKPHIPNRTVVEQSGFTNSSIPIIGKTLPLSDVTADELHPTEVNRLKHKNTPEYQNLFNPDPFVSTSQISYQQPARERAVTATTIRRGPSGYGHNETITAGVPGDARTFKTGITETTDKFQDPELGFRGRKQLTANVVERSGFWGSN